MLILGISAFYHDSAACLINNGEIISAAQEERFNRIKHYADFPAKSIEFCLRYANCNYEAIDFVVFYEKPFLKFERLLETYLAFAPRGFKSFSKAMPLWIKDKLFQKKMIIDELKKIDASVDWSKKTLFSEHHLSHAASAFFPSPFKSAAILTMDGVGEWATSSVALGNNSDLKVLKEINFPHSLGLLYSAFTYYAGFKVNSGEYKVMGLAPYGSPKYVSLIKDNLIEILEDGSFRLNMEFFDYCTGLTMTNYKFNQLFGAKPRDPETKLIQFHMDLAASVQKVTEEVIIKMSKHIAKETNMDNLCLAGGVALNCVANGFLLKEGIFKRIWIQPASGDAGGAIGAALAFYYSQDNIERNVNKNDGMNGSYLGPDFGNQEIEKKLVEIGAKYKKYEELPLVKLVSSALSKGKAIGWMNGRMEFGPRSLGSRSIIADARSKVMQKNLNLKVKYRESFRPFAPSILREDLSEWFDLHVDSPYMLLVADVAKKHQKTMSTKEKKLFGIDKLNVVRSDIPAVTHVDYSARIQTVHQHSNPRYYKLLKEFKKLTGCPVLVNTSFNVRGEPIVCSPEDAFKCFMGTDLDILVIGDYVLVKEEQDDHLNENYKDKYELD